MTETPQRRRVLVVAPTIPVSIPFRVGAVLVTLAALGFRAYTAGSWSYLQDDWVVITGADNTPLLDYVRQSSNGHLTPIGSALIWVANRFAPLNFTWVVVLTCALTVAVMVGWGLALRELFGERLRLVGGLVLIGFAPSVLAVSIWYSAIVIYLPLQATLGFATYFLARYLLRGEQRRDRVLLTLTVLVGLLFWQKSVLVAIPLAFIPLMVGEGTLRQRARRAVTVLWPSAVLIALFLAVYLTVPRPQLDTYPVDFPVGRTPGQIVEFYWTAAGDLVLPAMIGGPFTEMTNAIQPFAATDPALRAVLLVVAGIGIVLTLLFRQRAWLAVLMAAAHVVAAYGLVLFSSRYDDRGLTSIWENRYLSDPLPVLILAMIFLVTPLRTQTNDAALARPLGPRPQLAAKVALGGYLLLAAALAVGFSVRNWHLTEPNSPKPWVDHLVADATAAGKANLYDSVAPDYVSAVYLFGAVNVSEILAPLDLPVTYNAPASTILMPGIDGRLVEAEVSSPAAGAVAGPQPDCGYLVEAGKKTTVPLVGDIYDYEWAIQLDYFSSEDLDLTVRAGDTETVVPITASTAGTIGRRVWVVVDTFDKLTMTSSGGQPFCVTQVAVGQLTATDRRPGSLG